MQSQHWSPLRRMLHLRRASYVAAEPQELAPRDGVLGGVSTLLSTVISNGSTTVSTVTSPAPTGSSLPLNPPGPVNMTSSGVPSGSPSGSGPSSSPAAPTSNNSTGSGTIGNPTSPGAPSSSLNSTSASSNSSSFTSSPSSPSSSFSSSLSSSISKSPSASSSTSAPPSSSSASSSPAQVLPLVASSTPSSAPAYTPPASTLSIPPSPSASSSSPLSPDVNNQASPSSSAASNLSASSNNGLSTGATVGIVIACIAVAVVAGIFIVRKSCLRRRSKQRETWLDTAYPFGGAEKPAADAAVPRSSAIPAAGSGEAGWTSFDHFSARNGPMSRGPASDWQFEPVVAMPAPPAPPPMAYNNPAATAQPGAPMLSLAPAGAAQGVAFAVVRSTFVPSLPDELSISPGETVRIVAAYDDGWALCRNMRGEQGVVPLECLEREDAAQGGLQYPGQGTGDWRLSNRQSSLYAAESPA